MDENTLPSPPLFRRLSPRVGLLLILLVSIAAVSWAVVCIYHLVHYSLGIQIAEVVVAFLVILVLRLVFVGIRVGLNTKRVLRKRRDHAKRIYCLFERSRTFQEFWFYLGLEAHTHELAPENTHTQQVVLLEPDQIVEPQSQKLLAEEGAPWIVDLEEEITKRGRPPDHSIDRWAKVVSAWERRDLWHDPITLDEFLCREFGECADGSPQVSRQTFYAWRKKVHLAARKQNAAEQDGKSTPPP